MDDGTVRKYDTENFRTRLIKQISQTESEGVLPIPCVTIVVEGGKDTIKNVYYDLKENIPVVIIDGSGRVADFFKRWLLYTEEEMNNNARHPDWVKPVGIDEFNDIEEPPTAILHQSRDSLNGNAFEKPELQSLFEKYQNRINEELEAMLTRDDADTVKSKQKEAPEHGINEKNETETLKYVLYCLQPAVRSQIIVFDLNSDNDLSEAIFRSICKVYHKPQSKQSKQLLELAMSWKSIDIAKELILQNSLENIHGKNELFIKALTKDLPNFVHEFIRMGVDPSEVFFPNDQCFSTNLKPNENHSRYDFFIQKLYSTEAVNRPECLLVSVIESDPDVLDKCIDGTNILNSIIGKLIGDHMEHLYFDTYDDELEYRKLRDHTMYSDKSSQIEDGRSEQSSKSASREMAQDYIMRDLFLWAILMNYIDMAKVFLAHMKYRICAALIATKILKEYSRLVPYDEIKKNYIENASYFENYAINCIDLCQKNNSEDACEIVLRQIELFGNISCLQIAANADDKLFVSHSCCVQALNNIWYDKLCPDQSKKRNRAALFIGFLSLGVLAPVLVEYRKESEETKHKVLQAKLESHGINYYDSYPLEYPRITKYLGFNRYCHQLINFHLSLPTKYTYHCVQYCFFLLLFSYTLLFKFEPPTNNTPSIYWTEILTIILVSCMLIEEIHFFCNGDSLTFFGKVSSYFKHFFKQMSAVAFVLFYIGLILRFAYANSAENFNVARIIMAYDLEIWWLRSMSFIVVVPFLGPHLVAIGKMLKDLTFFMFIIAIVMIAYGVTSRSMAYYPNPELNGYDINFDGRGIFRQIIYPVYYFMYGNMGNETTYLDGYPDEGWSIATHVLLAFHMLFVNILLINLLIAMFSKRFDQVYDDTKTIWHYQSYLFTREYFDRPPFFPPISLFYNVYYLGRLFYSWVRRLRSKKSVDSHAKVFKIIPIRKEKEKTWYEFEGASSYEYAHMEIKASGSDSSKKNVNEDSSSVSIKVDHEKSKEDSNSAGKILEKVQEEINDMKKDVQSLLGFLPQRKRPNN
ncbi:unnamed protein product [Adineta steineri]|uniref:Uncharacterized protein n=2 Tax=Adineta steineri TaxID=433720 RepID=A0A814H3E9_9BILA|nr:unnamed protein product [Adineta steineri]